MLEARDERPAAIESLGECCDELDAIIELERDRRETLSAVGADPTYEDVAEDFDEIERLLEQFRIGLYGKDDEEFDLYYPFPVDDAHYDAVWRTLHSVSDRLVDLWEYLKIDSPRMGWEAVFEDLARLRTAEPVLVYSPPSPTIHIPQLIISTQRTLLNAISETPDILFQITPREFEELIREIFARRGFDVELTQQTRDGGRDIIAIGDHMNMRHKYLIECKRYARDRNVSIAVVQRLYGVKVSEGATKAILATTSDFTSPAQAFARQHMWELELKAYGAVMKWIRDYRAA
jgi:HJR/Mrr/RecB family endonuclease